MEKLSLEGGWASPHEHKVCVGLLFHVFDELTERERQVLELIAEGLTNRQIGERLDLMEKTVKNYVTGLLRKLGMERRTQAAVYATSLRSQ